MASLWRRRGKRLASTAKARRTRTVSAKLHGSWPPIRGRLRRHRDHRRLCTLEIATTKGQDGHSPRRGTARRPRATLRALVPIHRRHRRRLPAHGATLAPRARASWRMRPLLAPSCSPESAVIQIRLSGDVLPDAVRGERRIRQTAPRATRALGTASPCWLTGEAARSAFRCDREKTSRRLTLEPLLPSREPAAVRFRTLLLDIVTADLPGQDAASNGSDDGVSTRPDVRDEPPLFLVFCDETLREHARRVTRRCAVSEGAD